MALTPAMEVALSGAAPTIFGAIEVELPGYDLRVLDGAGVVTFGGRVFTGRDPVFGVLGEFEDIEDGAGDEAPAFTMTLFPPDNSSAVQLASPDMQGARVSVWLGAVDPMTGGVIPDPELLFLGEIDVPTLKSGRNSRKIEFEVVSGFERFFDEDEGVRLANCFHQSIWPGEEGLAFVTGVEDIIYWGLDQPTSSVTLGSGYGAYGRDGRFGNVTVA